MTDKKQRPRQIAGGAALLRNGPLWKRGRGKGLPSPDSKVRSGAYFFSCFRSQSFPSTKRETMKQVT